MRAKHGDATASRRFLEDADKITDREGAMKLDDESPRIVSRRTQNRVCLDVLKISKLYKILYYIESLNACMKH